MHVQVCSNAQVSECVCLRGRRANSSGKYDLDVGYTHCCVRQRYDHTFVSNVNM